MVDQHRRTHPQAWEEDAKGTCGCNEMGVVVDPSYEVVHEDAYVEGLVVVARGGIGVGVLPFEWVVVVLHILAEDDYYVNCNFGVARDC